MSPLLNQYRELVETRLEQLLPAGELRAASRLNAAVRYAIFPGGKRMRPILALLGAHVASAPSARALSAACATEFLHASSLIFDDLPAMDDADVRRGRPALHLVFGEDVALLTALALLNQAYSIFGCSPELIREATQCIGVNGMIGGQAADLEIRAAASIGEATGDACLSRNRKTTALMRLTLTAGAISCEASHADVQALARCGECFGEAYQIYDDLLDEYGRAEETGKTAHQDARHHRASHVSEYGADTSREQGNALIRQAKAAITERFGETTATAALLGAMDAIVAEACRAALATA